MFTRKRNRVRVTPSGVSRTEQHFKHQQDVNSIVARCMRGDMSGLKSHGICDDISMLPDNLHDLLTDRIDNGHFLNSVFDKLPEDVRAKYNTPSEFLNALGDETNRPFFEKFGIFNKKESTPVPVNPVPVNPVTVTPPSPTTVG